MNRKILMVFVVLTLFVSAVYGRNPAPCPTGWILEAAKASKVWPDGRCPPEESMSINEGFFVSGETISLEGWRFKEDPTDIGRNEKWYESACEDQDWKSIKTPAFWADTWVGDYTGYGWYCATVELPVSKKGQAMEVDFGAVDEQAWVYMNGRLAGEHSVASEGRAIGQLWQEAFTVHVKPEYLKYGQKNSLIVLVNNAVNNGGIWKPVTATFPDLGFYVLRAMGGLDQWRFHEDGSGQGTNKVWYAENGDAKDWKPTQILSNPKPAKGWYRTTFPVPAACKDPELELMLGGVSGEFDLYVNGQFVGAWGAQADASCSQTLNPGCTVHVGPDYLQSGQDNIIVIYDKSSMAENSTWDSVRYFIFEKTDPMVWHKEMFKALNAQSKDDNNNQ